MKLSAKCMEFAQFVGYVGELSEFRLIRWNFRGFSATVQASPTHRTDYQSTTDLMATTKMHIAWTSTF